MLSLRAAGVVSTVIEGILYGFSVFMFILAGWIMFRDRVRRHVNYAMVAAGCGLLVLSTVEMGVNTARVYQGFITVGPFLTGGPEAYFGDVSTTTFVTKSCVYNAQTLILDAVVIYRTYIVWQSFWVVVLPIIGWLGLFAASIGLNIALVTAGTHKGDVFAEETGRWITANYSMTLGTNLSSTSLLAFKIWTVARQSAQYRSNNVFGPVLRVIIESGAIYSMTITAALISFVVKSPGVYVVLDMISPIISIVFNMLIIRIGIANDRVYGVSNTGGTNQGSSWRDASRAASKRRRTDGSYVMQDLKVEITQVVEDDSQFGPRSPRSYIDSADADGDFELKGDPLAVDDDHSARRGPWRGAGSRSHASGSKSPSPSAACSEEGSGRDSGSFVAAPFSGKEGKAVDRGCYAV